MSVASRAQVGIKDEVTYGTAVTVDRFYEYLTEAVVLKPGRVLSPGLRSGTRTMRNDRTIPHRGSGAGGPVSFDVMNKGFGVLLKHMLGSIATGATTDSKTVHTATEGTLLGKAFTFQSNRPFHPADTDQAFTVAGCKIPQWELVQDVADGPAGTLKLNLTLDGQDIVTGTGLASASYPAGLVPFGWPHLAVTIGGAAIPLRRLKVGCNNGLVGAGGTDRAYARGSDLKQEPVEGGQRAYDFEVVSDFSDLTQYNRFAAAVTSPTSLYAAIVATWTQTGILIGSSSVATIVLTIPAARFDGDPPGVPNANPLQTTWKGQCLYDGTNSPVSIAYGTADATP